MRNINDLLNSLGEDELLRTTIDGGSPGGYMLTVMRSYVQDGSERIAMVFVDDVLVASRENCDTTEFGYEVEVQEAIDQYGIDVDRVINCALEMFGTLYEVATS